MYVCICVYACFARLPERNLLAFVSIATLHLLSNFDKEIVTQIRLFNNVMMDLKKKRCNTYKI